ncbi:MAG TPA: helix-turn-helix domain-containing protein [Flavobacterium sp.]|uniref:helix-turn-helix domain-containing protein n=1 Tax=Flavobacterium sp. TaxID=239 RepID=UPI002C2263CF|nr:helix-turn-helix domain-containing protein [Flavobacterium sp.]HNP33714.1 helix-turn-helix domain-containing protein [Flavobacterium sp.]
MNQKYFVMLMGEIAELKAMIKSQGNATTEEILLDSYDMQKMLNISASTLQKLRKAGTIPCNRIGRKYYYPKSFFTQEFLNSIIKVEDPSKKFDD